MVGGRPDSLNVRDLVCSVTMNGGGARTIRRPLDNQVRMLFPIYA